MLQINVSKKHILAGRRCSRLYCPVAKAIKEKFPKAKIIVQLDLVTIDKQVYITPKPAMLFMLRYDSSRDKLKIPESAFRFKKACLVCKHEEHTKGKCSVIVDEFKISKHTCPCGNC